MIRTQWPQISIKSLIESGEAETQTGPFGTQLKASDYVEHGTPVINVRNIGFGTIRPEKLEFIAPETVQRLSSHVLKVGDIVFGRKGAVERHVLIRAAQTDWFQGSDCLRLRLRSKRIDPRFVSYFLLTTEHQQWMLNQCSHGATMASLNQEIIGRIVLHLPALTTQRKIASVLSAYDDLIETNTRRIAILEEMAQSLYREWFAEFRFPGHEKARFIDSPLGQIPKGWECEEIGKVIDTLGGGTPSTKEPRFWDGGEITWYSPTDLTKAGAMFISGSAKRITPDGLAGSSAKPFPAYSVMMTSRATIGVVSITTTEACTNQGFITCVPNERLTSVWLYFWLHEKQEMIAGMASGATFKEISRGTFRKLLVAVPSPAVSRAFADATAPCCKLLEVLLKKQVALRTTRDLLLPKLMSGQVDVEDLDIDIGESLAEADA